MTDSAATPAAASAGPVPPAADGPGAGRLVARAAGLIAVLTVLSRAAGFVRSAIFGHTVGDNLLGDIYNAANAVPNIIFEIVAGGTLAGLVVPLLAGAIVARDVQRVSVVTSALLTWALAILLPIALAVGLLAGPIVGLAFDTKIPAQHAVGVRMLEVFAVQLPLYGIAVVLTGVLQAHRRFAWPVVAPLLSSLAVGSAYLAFAAVEGAGRDIPQVGRAGELILSVGTTLGVAVLALCLFVALRGLRLRLRPTFTFPADLAQNVRRFGLAGVATVAAQQLWVAVSMKLASHGPKGTWTQFVFGQMAYLLPWAVLAVPVATAAYPRLATARSTGDEGAYRRTLASATRVVVLLSCVGAAALVAVAHPMARVLLRNTTDAGNPDALATGILWFAPGLVGYGLFALLSRALYARGEARVATVVTVGGWLTAIGAGLALAAGLPPADRLLALAAGNSLGMVLLGALLIVVVARRVGRDALSGVGRAAAVGGPAAVVAAFVGVAVGRLVGPAAVSSGLGGALVESMLSGAAVGVAFLAVAYPLDHRDVRPLVLTAVGRLRGLLRRAGDGEREEATP